jgi:RNAse (barnase) inhibitor barstar
MGSAIVYCGHPSVTTYILDGTRFYTLEELFDEVTRSFRVEPWGRNLDAFNDILSGG